MSDSSGERGASRSPTPRTAAPGPATAVLRTAAGLIGAAGVMLGAAAAHAGGGGLTMTASTFALLHAGVLLALTGEPSDAGRPVGRMVAGWLLAVGTLLFSGDLALLGLTGRRLFSGAAPTGGLTLILAWLLIALLPWFRARRS